MKAEVNSEGYLVISGISKFSPSKGLQIISQRDGANLAKDSFEATTEAIAYKKMYEEAKLSADDSVRYKTLYEAELARRKDLDSKLSSLQQDYDGLCIATGVLFGAFAGTRHAWYLQGLSQGLWNARDVNAEWINNLATSMQGYPEMVKECVDKLNQYLTNKKSLE